MIAPKQSVERLYRINQHDFDRQSYLRLDMNENVEGLPQEFLDAIRDEYFTAGKLASYPAYDKIINKIATVNGINSEQVCVSNGSDAAIKYIFDAYISPNDTVLITNPTFAMYAVYCEMFGANVISVPYESNLQFPFEHYKNELKKGGIRLAVVVNPNNPTGSVLNAEKIEELVQLAHENNTLFVVDEAYFYYYDQTMMSKLCEYNNLIVLRTFSKLLGMANCRLGYAAADACVIQNLLKVSPSYDVNGFSVFVAEKVLSSPRVITEMIDSVKAGREHLINGLSASGVPHHSGYGNFILIDVGVDTLEAAKALRKKGILVAGGFRQPYLKQYIRATLGGVESMECLLTEILLLRGAVDEQKHYI